jgi:hypothetical protein
MRGNSDASPNLEATAQPGWCRTQIEEQKSTVIRQDQTKQTDAVVVTDGPRECHDRSDVVFDELRPTAIELAGVLSQ